MYTTIWGGGERADVIHREGNTGRLDSGKEVEEQGK